MKDFLLSPLLSLFSLSFYRRINSRKTASGFFYVGYLSLILTFTVLLAYRIYFFPSADQFMKWLGGNLPPLTVTRQGVQMELKQPLLLTHPQWGPLVYFDPVSEAPKPEDLEKALVIVTRTTLSYRDPRSGETRIQRLIPEPRKGEWRDMVLTGDRLLFLWSRTRPLVGITVVLGFFIASCLWKLLVGLLYSLVGLLFNRFRREPLTYSAVLNVAFFALTPVTLLQGVGWLVPAFVLPFGFLISLVLTAAYLAFGILATQQKAPGTS